MTDPGVPAAAEALWRNADYIDSSWSNGDPMPEHYLRAAQVAVDAYRQEHGMSDLIPERVQRTATQTRITHVGRVARVTRQGGRWGFWSAGTRHGPYLDREAAEAAAQAHLMFDAEKGETK